MDGKHPVRLQNVNLYVWTGPKNCDQFDTGTGELPYIPVKDMPLYGAFCRAENKL